MKRLATLDRIKEVIIDNSIIYKHDFHGPSEKYC